MEDIQNENESTFGKDLAKSFASSTAIAAGMTVGFIAGGYAINAIQLIAEKRRAIRAQKNEQ